MSRGVQAIAWTAILLGFVTFLVVFDTILLPFVLGMAIAYSLDPVADRLEAWRVPRGIAAILILLGFTALTIMLSLLLLPLLGAQVSRLVANLPAYAALFQEQFARLTAVLQARLTEEEFDALQSAVQDSVRDVAGMAGDVLGGVVTSGVAFFQFLALLFVTPVVAFYMLRDWNRFVAGVDAMLPRRYRDTIVGQMREVDRTLAGFVRGQVLVCVLLGTFYAVGLTIAGLEFGLVVGLFAGLVSFIPYVGTIMGGLLSIGLAFAQFEEFWRVFVIVAIFAVGQAIEGNILSPVLVGDRVRLHPVWIIFALFAGGSAFGFVGMLLAIPVAAIIGVLVRFFAQQYRRSHLYDDSVHDRETS